MTPPRRPEGRIQAYFISELAYRHWYVQKTVGQSRNGYPDITAVDPNGNVWFIEMKKAGGHVSDQQRRELTWLKRNEANVAVVYGENGVYRFLEYIDAKGRKSRKRILKASAEGEISWVVEPI